MFFNQTQQNNGLQTVPFVYLRQVQQVVNNTLRNLINNLKLDQTGISQIQQISQFVLNQLQKNNFAQFGLVPLKDVRQSIEMVQNLSQQDYRFNNRLCINVYNSLISQF